MKYTLIMTFILWTPKGLASFYPPGYPVEKNCQEQGPLEICTINHHHGLYPRLELIYRGYLVEKDWGHLKAWVRLNGREGVFTMSNKDYAEHLWLNRPQAHLCYVTTVIGGLRGENEYGPCKGARGPEGALVWEVDPIPAEERDLFFYARDPYDKGNAWDIEVAVTNGQGKWDSLFGSNYRFRFE